MEELRNAKGQTLAEFLAAYDVNKYPHLRHVGYGGVYPARGGGGAMPKRGPVRRGEPSDLGRYALPGGFLNMDETSLEGAARELEEETGVTGVALRRFGVFDALDRDPPHPGDHHRAFGAGPHGQPTAQGRGRCGGSGAVYRGRGIGKLVPPGGDVSDLFIRRAGGAHGPGPAAL